MQKAQPVKGKYDLATLKISVQQKTSVTGGWHFFCSVYS